MEVSQLKDGEQWAVRFSGKYGQFCDKLQDNFGKESSPRVVREKIKRHLLKQVEQIRKGEGRSKITRGRSRAGGRKEPSGILSTPLDVLSDIFGRASGIATDLFNRASGAAETASESVSSVAQTVLPAATEMLNPTPESQETATIPSVVGRPDPAADEAAARVSRRTPKTRTATKAAGKEAGKTRTAAQETTGKAARKTAPKTTRKTARKTTGKSTGKSSRAKK
jgi:hypothetical protein